MEKSIFFIPLEKKETSYSDVLKRVTDLVLLCEENNFESAFFGEHLADQYEKISSSLMMIASLANITNRIKLGSMTANLTFSNPAHQASLISTVDNLVKGRLLLGIGCGSNQCDVEAVGNLGKDNYKMMYDYLNVIIELFKSKIPQKIKYGEVEVNTQETGSENEGLGIFDGLYKFRQDIEIMMPALGLNSMNVKNCAINGWSILSTNFCEENVLKNHILEYKENFKGKNTKEKIRISRFIFVCEKESDAEKYLFKEDSPYLFMIDVILKKLKKIKKDYIFGDNSSDPKEIARNIIIYGTPDIVSEKIKSLEKDIGEFKSLSYASIPRNNLQIYDNSLELFAKNVTF